MPANELRTPLTSLGIDLESLLRNPDLPADQRIGVLGAMAADHTRMVVLLEGLQALARGDTGTLPAVATVEVNEVVEQAVDRARRRHPEVSWNLRIPDPQPRSWAGRLALTLPWTTC